MKSVEAQGKNIEQAIENALFELKAPREDVDIKILSEGGLFKKAKVLVSISADAIEKYEKKDKKNILEDDGLIIHKKEEKEEKKEEKKAEKTEEKQVKKAEKQEVKEGKKEEKEEVKHKSEIKMDPEEFLKGVFKAAGKEISIEKTEDEHAITYRVSGEDVGNFIGYRGEALFALSHLTSTLSGRDGKRVLVDIENYRQKRIETLQALAERMANKVVKSGRYVKLEPMEPAERRIIHLALQDNDKVTTLSKGTEPHRFVLIFPREYKED